MIGSPLKVPLFRCRRIHRAMSLTLELAPPAGDWASGSRWYLATHFPSCHIWPRARFGRAKKSDRRELVEFMPKRLYSRSSEIASHDFPAALEAATAPSVIPKLV